MSPKQHDYANHRYINLAALTVTGSFRTTQVMTNDPSEVSELLERWMLKRDADRIVSAVIHDTLTLTTDVYAIENNHARIVVQEGRT